MRQNRNRCRIGPMGFQRSWNGMGQFAAKQKPAHQQPSCQPVLQYAGNIFLLGLFTLFGELIDLRAGAVLETLLAPFQCELGENLEEDVLAGEFAETEGVVDLAAALEQEL